MNFIINEKIQVKLFSIISEEVFDEFIETNSIDFIHMPNGELTYIINLDKTITLIMEKKENNISIKNISLGPVYVNTGAFTRELNQ